MRSGTACLLLLLLAALAQVDAAARSYKRPTSRGAPLADRDPAGSEDDPPRKDGERTLEDPPAEKGGRSRGSDPYETYRGDGEDAGRCKGGDLTRQQMKVLLRVIRAMTRRESPRREPEYLSLEEYAERCRGGVPVVPREIRGRRRRGGRSRSRAEHEEYEAPRRSGEGTSCREDEAYRRYHPPRPRYSYDSSTD